MLVPYEKVFAQGTQFKTTCNPDVIEHTLVEYLKNEGITHKVDEKKYKIKFEQSLSAQGAKNPYIVGVRVSIL